MKKFLILILLFSFCLPENNNKRNNYNKNKMKKTMFSTMSEEAKMTFYKAQKLSPEKASLYQLVLPFPFINLGYSYSNNWKKGAMADIALVTLMIARQDVKDRSEYCYQDCEDADNVDLAMGIVVLYKVFKANQLAEKHNRKMFKKLFGVKSPNFSFNYSNEKNSPELSLNFPLN